MEEKKEKIEVSQEEDQRHKDRMAEADRKDYENKLRELSEFQESIESIDVELERVDRDKESFKKISKIIIDNYGKPSEKREWNWEVQAEYWAAKKEQEQIQIERKLDEFDRTKKQLQKNREQYLDQIESLEKAVKDYEAKQN